MLTFDKFFLSRLIYIQKNITINYIHKILTFLKKKYKTWMEKLIILD